MLVGVSEFAILTTLMANDANESRLRARNIKNGGKSHIAPQQETILRRWLHELDGCNSTSSYNNAVVVQDLFVSPTMQAATCERLEAASSVRIFVSSTFTDMLAEREIIATKVAPRVARLCDSIGVVCNFVDLRWGVTKEDVDSDRGVYHCLESVKASDIMLLLVGSRYGWHGCRNEGSVHGSDAEAAAKSAPLLRAIELAAREGGQRWMLPSLDHRQNNNNNNNISLNNGGSKAARRNGQMQQRQLQLQFPSVSAGEYLRSTSVTELELRTALHVVAPAHIHAFVREQASEEEQESCPEAARRLDALRRVACNLPSTRSYKPFSTRDISSYSHNGNSGGCSESASAFFEEAAFQAVCASIKELFAKRQEKKPRKFERERNIQNSVAARALVGFCEL